MRRAVVRNINSGAEHEVELKRGRYKGRDVYEGKVNDTRVRFSALNLGASACGLFAFVRWVA